MTTRHERVIVDLDDRLSRPMAGMAASVSLFRRNIDGADRDTIKFDKTTQDVGRNIDKLSGRLGLLVDVAATLGPALIPTAAAAVPLLAGLSNQLGFAAIAGGSTILAFQGVGDALKALNEQQLNPSAANLEKLHQAMATLGPAGRDFVRELQSLRPELQKLQTAAQAGLFPGMTEGITALTTRLPQAERIISEVTDTLGGLLADAGKSLAGPEWNDFFNMLESEARPTLQNLGESIGQVTKGLADLWVAFAPLNRDFSRGMLDASKSFADWADGLSKTQGFADFMAYLDQTGPQVAQTLGAVSKALLNILEAAAPLGGPALTAIKAFSTAISAIANSDLGTPLLGAVAAWRAYSLAVGLAGRATTSFVGQQAIARTGFTTLKKDTATWLNFGATSRQEMEAQRAAGERVRGTLLKGAAGAAAFGLATSGMADKIGVANTATLGLAGAMIGPWGAAAGAGVGAFLDLKAAGESFGDTLDRLNLASKSGNIEAISKQIAAAKAQIDDINHTSGVGDFFSDIGKTKGASLANLIPGASIESDKANAAIAQGQSAKGWASLAATVQKAATASALAARGFQLTAAGAREAAGGINAFTAAANRANAAITRQGAFDAYRSALLDFNEGLKQNGRTLDKNTRSGLANRANLRNMASAALTAAQGIKSVADRAQYLQKARRNFIDAAVAAGATRAAAKRLADQFGLIGRINAKPKVELKGAQAAISAAHAINAAINAINPFKSVTIQTKRTHIGDPVARGGIFSNNVRRYAYGDVANRHMPELAGPGPTRIWREPETMGEAYIPLANDDRRPRARAIAAETVSLLGGTAHFATGGLTTAERRRNNDGHDGKKHETALDRLRDRINRLTKAVDKSEKAIDKERTKRDDLVSARNDLASTVGGKFTTDLFGSQPDNLSWMNPAQKQAALTQGVFSTLKSDIANANTFKSTLTGLKKRGLDGQALADLAASGDIQRAQAFSKLSNKDLGSYESLFNQRAAATASVGATAGNAVYGAAIAAQNKHLLAEIAELKGLRADLKKAEKKKATIHVHDKSGSPKKTAKEVSRRQAMAG